MIKPETMIYAADRQNYIYYHGPLTHRGAYKKVINFLYFQGRKDVHEKKTFTHFLGKCPALVKAKHCVVGKFFIDSLK